MHIARYYVRIDKLTNKLLDKIDEDKLKFIPAVEISWLLQNELDILLELFEGKDIKISLKQAKLLREESEKSGGNLKKENIMEILKGKVLVKRRNVILSDGVSARLDNYGEYSGKVICNIISV